MKNIKKILWAMMPVAAALMLASCSSDDDQFAAPQSVNTIPYTVSVSDGGTRAAFADDSYTGLVFAAGDKLYINNADGTVYGTLTMQSGSGTNSATFSGELSYTGAAPTAETALTATLLSADNEVVQIGTDHVAAPQYGGICTNLAQAVSKYSYLSGAGTFGGAAFALSQGTAFLNFNVTLNDGEAGSKTVTVKNFPADIASGTVSGENSVSFVAPVAVGTTLNGASVYVEGWKPSDSFGSTLGGAALTAKVYNITKTVDKPVVPAGVQWIDLGIEVGGKKVFFADRNVGATNGATRESWFGDHFMWGAIVPCNDVDCIWDNYPYCKGSASTFTKYVTEANASEYGYNGFYDNKTVLDPEDNPVYAQWGTSVYLPTYDEWTALMDTKSNTTNYTWTWKTNYNSISGLNGWLITWNGTKDAAADGTTLFLPAAGYRFGTSFYNLGSFGIYWSSSLNASGPSHAWCLFFSSGDVAMNGYNRDFGRSLRAVQRI